MTLDIEAIKAAAEKAKAQGWRVRTNRHTATNGDEWGWLSDSDDRSNYMGGLKVTWEGKEAQATARFVVSAPTTILELIAQNAALREALTVLVGEVEAAKEIFATSAKTPTQVAYLMNAHLFKGLVESNARTLLSPPHEGVKAGQATKGE